MRRQVADLDLGEDPPSTGTARSLSVGRRRALPSGRAVAGGFVMALAAVLAFGAWLVGRPGPGTTVAVAAHPLAAGTVLDASDLSTTVVRVSGAALGGLADPSRLVGRTLAVGVAAGDAVGAADLVPAGGAPPLRPVPVPVPASDLVDLGVGSHVDLLVTASSGQGSGTSSTRMLVRGAQVMAVDQGSQGLVGGTSTGDVLTVGVSDLAEVQAVVAAEHAGTVDVVVAEPSDGSGQGS